MPLLGSTQLKCKHIGTKRSSYHVHLHLTSQKNEFARKLTSTSVKDVHGVLAFDTQTRSGIAVKQKGAGIDDFLVHQCKASLPQCVAKLGHVCAYVWTHKRSQVNVPVSGRATDIVQT